MQKIGKKIALYGEINLFNNLSSGLPFLGGHGIISSPWNEITQEAQSHCSNLSRGCQKKKKKLVSNQGVELPWWSSGQGTGSYMLKLRVHMPQLKFPHAATEIEDSHMRQLRPSISK